MIIIGDEMGERRIAPRAARAAIKVHMEGRKNGDVFTGISVNLSETGVLIETAKQLDPGQEVKIRMILPNDEEIVGFGTVVRREAIKLGTFGVAVHWTLDEFQRERIADIIERSI